MAFYLLARQGAIVQWGALLVGLAGGRRGAFASPRPGRQLVAFGRDCLARGQEGGLADAQGSDPDDGSMCLPSWSIMAVFLWLTDKTLEWVFFDLILGWRK